MKQMKKVLSLSYLVGYASLAGCTALISAPAMADTILGGYVGIQGWNMSAEGGFAQNESLAAFTFKEEANTSFYAALEHPIPLVPNIKLARTTLNTSGSSVISNQLNFGDQVFLVDASISSQVELTATDYILYYEILDNDLISLDVGISGKQIEGDIFVVDSSGRSGQQNIDIIVPMGYAKVQVGLPFTGLSVMAEGSLIAIDDDSFSDYQIALAYNFVETLALDLTIQAGYRSSELDLNDVDDIFADMQFDGGFIGIEFDF
jgi:outer membrane protein